MPALTSTSALGTALRWFSSAWRSSWAEKQHWKIVIVSGLSTVWYRKDVFLWVKVQACWLPITEDTMSKLQIPFLSPQPIYTQVLLGHLCLGLWQLKSWSKGWYSAHPWCCEELNSLTTSFMSLSGIHESGAGYTHVVKTGPSQFLILFASEPWSVWGA